MSLLMKVLLVTLSVATVIGVTGCGDKQGKATSSSVEPVATSQASETSAESTPIAPQSNQDTFGLVGTWAEKEGSSFTLNADGTFTLQDEGRWGGQPYSTGDWEATALENGAIELSLTVNQEYVQLFDGERPDAGTKVGVIGMIAKSFKMKVKTKDGITSFSGGDEDGFNDVQPKLTEALEKGEPFSYQGADGKKHTVEGAVVPVDQPKTNQSFITVDGDKLKVYGNSKDAQAGKKSTATYTRK